MIETARNNFKLWAVLALFIVLLIVLSTMSIAQTNKSVVYKGHDLPRLRGAMISSKVTAEDLKTLGLEWRANHVRWQLNWVGKDVNPENLDAYDAWLEGALGQLDRLLPVCAEAGLIVLIDLHTPPGGRDNKGICRLFSERKYQDKFIEVWTKIAQRYKGKTIVWGYDLLNEAVEGKVALYSSR